MRQAPFTELVEASPGGRVFDQARRPGLGDCAPSGRMRLDALARWIQDLAYADVEDAGVAERAMWVMRRARLRVERFPRFGESILLSTFCTGLGRMWAERRTTMRREGSDDVEVDAVSLWVHIDPVARRPSALSAEEISAYRDAVGGRRISARLRHPGPRRAERSFPWFFRASECDLAGHINNAAYWYPLEEELLNNADPECLDVEIEYRTPAQPGHKKVLCEGHWRWILGEGGETHASIVMV